MSAPGKRAAYEPAKVLLRPHGYDPEMKRPLTTVVGAVLVLLRSLSGFLWIAGFTLEWPSLLREQGGLIDAADLDAIEGSVALWVIVAVSGVVFVVDAVLGILILNGHNLARVIIMSISVVSITVAFVGWWSGGQEVRIFGALPALAFDILVLLALSSRSAAAYARRNERR